MCSGNMKQWVIIGICVFLIGVAAFFLRQGHRDTGSFLSPLSANVEKPLEKYSIPRLSERTFTPAPIVFDTPVATTSGYTAYTFHFDVDGKKVTGLAHVPHGWETENRTYPVIVQLRGYVDIQIYAPGVGTAHSAEVFSTNGFISLAPDFLGYGGSDPSPANSIEDRFWTYTTVLQLLASIGTVPHADVPHVGLWGHSNGGQIALTVLTILADRGIPTVLWAPVSKPFPYNILYYTDEFDDHGKALRKAVADFEKDYDADQFSLTSYLDRINAPMQFHQGGSDESVPIRWTDDFVALLKKKGKDVRYFIYSGMDHNMSPTSDWNTIMDRDIRFFRTQFKMVSP